MIDTSSASVLWVCEDCYFTHHGLFELHEDYRPDREPMSLVSDDVDVFAGLPLSEHEDGCTSYEDETECECAHITFSRSACDGCGSQLAGTREALTTFERDAR